MCANLHKAQFSNDRTVSGMAVHSKNHVNKSAPDLKVESNLSPVQLLHMLSDPNYGNLPLIDSI